MVSTLPVQEPTIDSLEGDLAHLIGERELLRASGRVFGAIPMVGEIKDSVVVTQEMADAVKVYVESALQRMIFNPAAIGIEDRIEIPDIHPECFGTCDLWMLSRNGTLYVDDFKYGHKFVKVENNPQHTCYASGLIRRLGLPPETKVVFTVVQPRTFTPEGPVRVWETTARDIWTASQVMAANAKRAMDPTQATLVTGPHCYYCEARLHCDPAIKLALALVELIAQPLPIDLTPAALGKQQYILDRAAEHIKSMRDATEEQIKALIKSGVFVPGWDLEDTYGREAWNKADEEIFHLGELLKINTKKATPITPAQARKAGIPAEVVAMYSHRPHSGSKLVREDQGKIARIFGGK